MLRHANPVFSAGTTRAPLASPVQLTEARRYGNMATNTAHAHLNTNAGWWNRPGVLELMVLIGPLALVGLILSLA